MYVFVVSLLVNATVVVCYVLVCVFTCQSVVLVDCGIDVVFLLSIMVVVEYVVL